MSSVQCYLYGSGAASGTVAAMDTYHTIGIDEGGGVVRVRMNATGRFDDALSTWQSNINAAGLAHTYTVTRTGNTIEIAASGSFALYLYGSAGLLLGFGQTFYASNTRHASDQPCGGHLELVSYECQLVNNADRAELSQYRHGRALGLGFGNVDLWRTSLYLNRSDFSAAFDVGYALTGRVRVQGTDATPYSATNLDGYVDGFIVATPELETYSAAERFARVSILVAVPR
jgi:hypothetical protein